MKQPQIIVGLLWHSVNSDNLGVGALTVSQIAIIDDVARSMGVRVQYRVLCWNDPAPPYLERGDVDVRPMRGRDLLRPSGLYAAARGCDVVLDISAGDSFADIYGARRFVYNALGKLAVLLARRPLVLSPQTIGPFERWWTSALAGMLMRKASRIVTRDTLSTEFISHRGMGERVVEATDVAFRLPYDQVPSGKRTKTRFGFNVSGLLFNGGYTQDNMFSLGLDYRAFVHAIIEHYSSLPDCEVHLVGHVNSHSHVVEDDFRVAEQLASEYPAVKLAPRFSSPSDAKSYIAALDFFCGSRMHACIAAFSSGVPVIPIAYSRKFAGVFGSLGYLRVADAKSQSASEIFEIIKVAFDDRDQLKSEVEAGNKIAASKLSAYEDVLRDLFDKARS